jgi:acyl-CoA dehydrogenase
LTAYAYLWTRMAELALAKAEGEDGAFYKGKLATARFFMAKLLPESTALFAQIGAGAKPLMALEAEAV